MVEINIELDKCNKCMLCVYYCPANVFKLEGDSIIADEGNCVECYGCIPLCPTRAIKISVENSNNHNNYTNILSKCI